MITISSVEEKEKLIVTKLHENFQEKHIEGNQMFTEMSSFPLCQTYKLLLKIRQRKMVGKT
jgi:hypothetical protein